MLTQRLSIVTVTGLLGVLLLAGGLMTPVAAAEEREGMTLAPTDVRYEVEPGQVVKGEMTILNDGQLPYDFRVYAAPYSVSGERYNPNFIETPPTSDVFRWIQFDRVDWHANVRETVQVPFTMRVSQDAAPGGHYGIIFAETQPDTSRGSVIRKKRLGMIMYVHVKGDSKLAGETQSIEIDRYQGQAPVTATISYTNTGNVHYMSKQNLHISDVFGRTVYSHEQELAVLPNKPRRVTLTWPGASWLGLYKVGITSIAVDKTTTKNTYVLVAPMWFLALVIATVGVGVVYAIRGKRTKRR